MTGGMAVEAMNNAGAMDSRLIVILNDNNMSIAPPVGAMSAYLARLTAWNTDFIFEPGRAQRARFCGGLLQRISKVGPERPAFGFCDRCARRIELRFGDFFLTDEECRKPLIL